MNLITDITSGLVVIAGAVVAESAVDPVTHYAGLLEKFGVMACLLVYFLVRDYLRTKADNAEKLVAQAKHEDLEQFIRTTLLQTLGSTNNNIKSSERTHKNLLNALEQKAPCLSDAAKLSKEHLKKDTETR